MNRILSVFAALCLSVPLFAQIGGGSLVQGFQSGASSTGGSGTVTSVGLTIGGFTVAGSPVTSSGTLAATLASPTNNAVVVSNGSGNLSAFANVLAATPAASTPNLLLNATWFTSGGTGTTTWPALLVQPSGTTSTTWNTAGTGIGVNAASSFTGNLLDLETNGSDEFNVTSTGLVSSSSDFRASTGSVSQTSFGVNGTPGTGIYFPSGTSIAFSVSGVSVGIITATSWQPNILLQLSNGSNTIPGMGFSSGNTTGLYFANPGIGFTIAAASVGTWTATLLTTNEGLSVAGTAYSYGAPVLNGASGLLIPATTYTLTGTSGVTNFGSVTLNIPNYTNASVNTITNLATLVIVGAPTVAGSQVGTNKWSIYAAAGTAFFGSGVQTNGNFIGANGTQFQNGSGSEAYIPNSASGVIKSNGSTFATFNGTAGTLVVAGTIGNSGAVLSNTAPTNGVGTWGLGTIRTTTGLVASTTNSLEITVGGTRYDIILATTTP